MRSTSVALLAALCVGCYENPRPPTAPDPEPVVKTGIEVTHIHREPRLDAPPDIYGPVTAGWPEAGRVVQWVAHVLNRTSQIVPGVAYTWRAGDEVTNGTVDLPPGRTEVVLPWTWTFERTPISFALAQPAIDPDGADNAVAIDSGALAVKLYVQRELYDWMARDDRVGFERQLQIEIDKWNAMLARGTYPSAPGGPRDRVRLDQVVVTDGRPNPTARDYYDADLVWAFRNEPSNPAFLHLYAPPQTVTNQAIVFHELLHQRGLADLYAYDVAHQPTREAPVAIEENGRLVAGTELMPSQGRYFEGFLVYRTPVNGIMGSGAYRASADVSELSVLALNLWAGRRTPRSTDRFGNPLNQLTSTAFAESHLWRFPQITVLTFADAAGARVPARAVDVFVDHHWDTYVERYAATPDFTLTADASGAVRLPGAELVSRLPSQISQKSQVVIFRVRTADARGYAFLANYYLNVAALRGRDTATIEVPVTMHRY